ncbi:Mammalian cell entry related domain protein [Mycobacterium intracellulare]|uniref:Mammalian cell entry related domain protein n=1 Tax=Mycobacterium intracellulare TaxID=1767 RepID=A0A7R7RN10_MYCIT|nr:Mammalian cell entry related domain protein [Mycobacterium intracellulare]MCA2249422.1 Mammalian cell entry related domain protein [Mycobacterium intracellulare]MCA2355648.1 Mammalian cell entry related domain protein [Mycobacterium intracellulare]MCA2364968.1 Mammalian cell entry related domain protein [Mycobacterium intracellulare]PBA54519.1 Mammalian cell entry related domain protein [Mycobacterium intracellulare subsp. chimaera]BCO98596.1 hypothetical protein MINTM018_13660 [Mycobacteri
MLLHASAESEKRTLTIVGTALVLCVVAVGGLLMVFKPFGGRPANAISMAIDTPYVGPGVAKGTELVMHGVKVGEVTAVSRLSGGGVRLNADLQKTPIAGLTDAMAIDFRPVNYFGVTGINLIAGAGGRPLRDGTHLKITPKGNFTLQALLSRLGRLATGTLTSRLIQVVEKATRYTDALDPLAETLLISANALANTQTVSTAQLLRNATGLSVAFPSFTDAMLDAGADLTHGTNKLNKGTWNASDDEYSHTILPFMQFVADNLFGAIGRLEYTHIDDLAPMVDTVKALTDVVPPLIRPQGISEMLVELRSRLEKMYAGTPEQRALQVRIVLDSLPGVAAPLAALGGAR